MTRPAETLEGIDSVNATRGALLMADREDPETEIAPTHAAPQSPMAWSADDDDETLLYPDDEPGELYTDADEHAYAWRTVQIFAGLIAVAVLAATWMVAVWWTHREDTAAAPTSAAPTVQTSPDDRIVAAPAPPPAAVPPPIEDDTYVAVAISPATKRVASYGRAGTEERARTIALNFCKSNTGDALCMIAESVHHGCAVVAFDEAGTFAGGKGPDAASAKADAIAQLPAANVVSEPECSK